MPAKEADDGAACPARPWVPHWAGALGVRLPVGSPRVACFCPSASGHALASLPPSFPLSGPSSLLSKRALEFYPLLSRGERTCVLLSRALRSLGVRRPAQRLNAHPPHPGSSILCPRELPSGCPAGAGPLLSWRPIHSLSCSPSASPARPQAPAHI